MQSKPPRSERCRKQHFRLAQPRVFTSGSKIKVFHAMQFLSISHLLVYMKYMSQLFRQHVGFVSILVFLCTSSNQTECALTFWAKLSHSQLVNSDLRPFHTILSVISVPKQPPLKLRSAFSLGMSPELKH